jgi:hypothetical protein
VKGQPQRFIRGHRRTPLADRFWSRIKKADGDACWEWLGQRIKGGYGMLFDGAGKYVTANRISWMLNIGAIPPGYVVRHLCNNPPCVRPDHLRLGTQLENMADRAAAGRTALGETNGKSKLSDEDVQQIRSLHAAGLNYRQIATRYPVHEHTISAICRGLWRKALHLGDEPTKGRRR